MIFNSTVIKNHPFSIQIVLKKNLSFILLFFFAFKQNLYSQDTINIEKKKTVKYKTVIIPTAMIIYGAIAVNDLHLKSVNEDVHEAVTPSDLSKQHHIDDYLQFTPAAIALGLNMIGIRGKHDVIWASLIYGMSNVFLNAVVFPTKMISHELRPNGLSYSSFPSGHTAEAFASAEFLRMEYQNKSIWYGVLGYSMACMTGYLRMYNNKHWFSDVLAGAAVGILSTRLSEWIYDKLEPRLFKNKSKATHTLLMPYYKDNSVGLGLNYHF
jgi:membrane-associated phospholipid phosphatase